MKRRDPLESLCAFYEKAPIAPSESFDETLRLELQRACAEPDFAQWAINVRMVAPLAAAVFALSVSQRASASDAESLAQRVNSTHLSALSESADQDLP